MPRKFFKSTVTLVVLSEDRPVTDDWSPADIQREYTEGSLVLQSHGAESVELTGPQMVEALYTAGSCPDFFRLDPDGTDLGEVISCERIPDPLSPENWICVGCNPLCPHLSKHMECIAEGKSAHPLDEDDGVDYEGTEGQDRESYSDDQDRENYAVDEEWEKED